MNNLFNKKLYLYVDLIICRSVYRPVQSKAHNEYPAVYTEPVRKEKRERNQRIYKNIKLIKYCVMIKQHVCAGLRCCGNVVHQLIRVVHDLSSQTRQYCSI